MSLSSRVYVERKASLAMTAPTCNPSTCAAEEGGAKVQGYSEKFEKSLSQKANKHREITILLKTEIDGEWGLTRRNYTPSTVQAAERMVTIFVCHVPPFKIWNSAGGSKFTVLTRWRTTRWEMIIKLVQNCSVEPSSHFSRGLKHRPTWKQCAASMSQNQGTENAVKNNYHRGWRIQKSLSCSQRLDT